MTARQSARISAPAKINLGLEIPGRREDGFHEIRSVLAMIDLVDDLSFTMNDSSSKTVINGMSYLAMSDNLIMDAIRAFSGRTGIAQTYTVSVIKRIPAPAGLGGASSNVAATLLALNALHSKPLSRSDLHQIAAGLGSDVPFFLGSTTALVTGRGTELTALPPVKGWVVLAIPRLSLVEKTARLYSQLTPDDFTDGSTVQQIAESIRCGEAFSPELLTNTFARPLREIMPDVVALADQMLQVGFPYVALSGAGPAHYALFDDHCSAQTVGSRLKNTLKGDVVVAVAPFRASPLTAEYDDQ